MTILLGAINEIVMDFLPSHYKTTIHFASIGEHSSRSFTFFQK